MTCRFMGPIAGLLLLIAPVASHAGLSAYKQDFERLAAVDPDALNKDGWQVFADVYSPDGSTLVYSYGAFPAPNGPYGFSRIAHGFDHPQQGAQQLVVFNDYNNQGAHTSGQHVQANVFQLQTVGAADTGRTWRFQFDARRGDLAAPSTARAFILTLDPANGYAVTSLATLDMTLAPDAWTRYAMSLPIAAGAGELLEFGFSSTATSYRPSAVAYDNLSFAPVPEPSGPALMLVGLGVLGCAVRRRHHRGAPTRRRPGLPPGAGYSNGAHRQLRGPAQRRFRRQALAA